MSWTDERIETLRNLWEKGLTASQIAEKLGNVSRNAVIGKAHRLGLKARPSPVKGDSDGTPRETAKKAAAPAAPRPKAEPVAKEAAAAAPEPRAVPEAKAPAPAAPKQQMPVRAAMPVAPVKPRAPGEKVTLLDLSDKICKWPIGHPGEPDFQFCGRPVNPGFPYCTAHCAEAYQAQLPRDRSRPSRAPMPPLPRVR